MREPPVVRRNLEAVLAQRLREEPVVVLNGARTVGKSTLLRACAKAQGVTVLDLDNLQVRAAVSADPARFVEGRGPVCIDEFQHVLPLLDAIKAELNQDLRPGRYLLTGSTRYATLPAASQSLTGRAHVVEVWPFSQGELRGCTEHFVDRLFSDPIALAAQAFPGTPRDVYEQIVLAGGLPLALARPVGAARARWYQDYVDLVLSRDVLEIRRVRQARVLPQILQRLAGQTGQLLNLSKIAQALAMEQSTVSDYVQLLEAVFLVHRLSAYGTTLTAKSSKTPKVHVVDTGLGAHLMGITASRLRANDPSALTEFGRLAESFAVNEIIKQAGWSEGLFTFGHVRTFDDQEVDLVIESHDGRVAGVEVKAASSPQDTDFRGLRVLRQKLGARFIAGIVLTIGRMAYTQEDRLHVLPLDAVWA